MVSHVLAGLGGEHLQECNLVRICFVGESKAAIFRHFRKPSFALLSLVCDLTRDGRFGCDASCQVFHVAVNQYGILRRSRIGIDPVLKVDNQNDMKLHEEQIHSFIQKEISYLSTCLVRMSSM